MIGFFCHILKMLVYQENFNTIGAFTEVLRGIPQGHGNVVQRFPGYENYRKVPMSPERLHSGKRRKNVICGGGR